MLLLYRGDNMVNSGLTLYHKVRIAIFADISINNYSYIEETT